MGNTVNIGVIGCGAIAERVHVPDYHVCPEAVLTAFCDNSLEQAQRVANRFAPKATIYTDYKELLSDPAVDAVSVCLPNVLHAPVSIAAAEAGKHVFVEKPMATSLEECKQMIAAAEKAGVLLMVNQTQRRYAPHRKAKEVLDSGILGKVLYVIGMFGHAGPDEWSPGSDWFFDKASAQFGAMADLGVHKADLIRWMTGKEIVEVSGYSERLEKDADVEDNFASSIKFEDGAIGLLGASWTAKGLGTDFTIFHCANGTLRVNAWPDKSCVAHLHRPSGEVVFEIPPPLNEYEGSWGVDAGGGFARAVLGLEEPFCTGVEGMKSFAVIAAAEASAKSGRRERVQFD